MQETRCCICQEIVSINNSINPCLCGKYYHMDCWDSYQISRNLLFYEKCPDCQVKFNIDFRDQLNKQMYKFFCIYQLCYVKLGVFIYLLSFILYLLDSLSAILIVNIFNILTILLFIINSFNLYKRVSWCFTGFLILNLTDLVLNLFEIPKWLVFSLYFLNINITRLNKKYIYIFSAKYHYLKFFNYARLN